MEEWRYGVDGSRHRRWGHWSRNIYPAFRCLADDVVRADSVRLHKHVAHLRSSQAFAFNLFLPFRIGGLTRLSERVSDTIGARVSIEDVRFEWVPPGPLLGEIDGEKPTADEPATAVDVVLSGRLAEGGRAVILCEVKLSESGFTHCKGRTSPNNKTREMCQSASLFLENPRACYLRRPRGKRRDRRYWEIFARQYGNVRSAFPGAGLEGPCPFAESMQQPMRNLAIAWGLEQDPGHDVERAWFVLCAHDDNHDVARHWRRWGLLLPGPSMAPALRASEVVRTGEEEGHREWADWMRERYRL